MAPSYFGFFYFIFVNFTHVDSVSLSCPPVSFSFNPSLSVLYFEAVTRFHSSSIFMQRPSSLVIGSCSACVYLKCGPPAFVLVSITCVSCCSNFSCFFSLFVLFCFVLHPGTHSKLALNSQIFTCLGLKVCPPPPSLPALSVYSGFLHTTRCVVSQSSASGPCLRTSQW